jgi:F-box-like
MSGVSILDFPTEILAKIFHESDVETVWNARAVCRYWRETFEMVSYGSIQSPLVGLSIGVEAICGIKSPMGELLDSHVVQGDLCMSSNKPTSFENSRVAKWSAPVERYVYWPGGKWRNFAIGEVLTDVQLRVSGLPQQDRTVTLPIGRDVSLRGRTLRRTDGGEEYSHRGEGRFQDFELAIDVIEEPSFGKINYKHCVKALNVPKWQIYAMLVRHTKTKRVDYNLRQRRYSMSYQNSFRSSLPSPVAKSQPPRRASCFAGTGVGCGWSGLPPQWNLVEALEC